MKKLLSILLCTVMQVSVYSQDTNFSIGQVKTIHSQILGEQRTLNIYLPSGFNAKDSIKYPVIYLLDGSADEDFIHIAGLVQFASFSWVNYLPPSIVVGIANVDRKRDFTFPTTIEADKKDFPTTGGSAKFISFIEKELQPYIEKNFPVNASKTIIGQSLGGLLATEVLVKKTYMFNRYIIVSPSLWWDRGSLLPKKIPVSQHAAEIYIAVGKEGEDMERDAKKLADLFSGIQNIKVNFDFLPQHSHGTILHEAVYKAFEWLGKNK